jgi:hypothetical protein
MTQQIQIEVGEHTITLQDGEWVPAQDDPKTRLIADLANLMSATYIYTPAHGQPGHKLAIDIARKMKGRAILPEIQPRPDGVVE